MDKHRRIEERAYFLWEREGAPHGHDRDHWAVAEAEIEAEDTQPRDDASAGQPAPAAPDRSVAPLNRSPAPPPAPEQMRHTAADKPASPKSRPRKKPR